MRRVRIAGEGLAFLLALAAFVALVPANASAVTAGPHPSILIDGDSSFTALNGVTGGNGTAADPYVIDGWNISDDSQTAIEIRNTRAPFVIRSVTVTGGGGADGVALTNVFNGRIESSGFDTRARCIRMDSSGGITVQANNLYNCLVAGVSVSRSRQVVVRSNLVSGSGEGIVTVSSSDSALVDNRVIGAFGTGIRSESMSNLSILGNFVGYTIYGDGINLVGGTEGNLSGNHLDSNARFGVVVNGFRHLTVANNTFTSDGLMIHTISYGEIDFDRISADNVVNGLPLLVYHNCASAVIDGAPVGELIIAQCSRVRVTNVTITNSDVGILTYAMSNSIIENNQLVGNHGYGVYLQASSDSIVRGNNVSDNSDTGIYLDTCVSIDISDNALASNGHGISVWDTGPLSVRRNVVRNSALGGIIASGVGMVFEDNQVIEAGVTIWISMATTLRRNSFEGGGINFWRDTALTLVDNRFVNGSLFFSEDDDQQAGGFLRGHTIGGDNTVNGLPVLYRQDCRDLQVSAPSYGQIILVGCSNVTLSDVAARHVTSALQLEYVHGAVVDGASIASSYAAIEIGWSESILVRNATLPGNAFGVNVWHSSGVTVDGINASRGSVGVAVAASNFVEIRRNDFVGNLVGVFLISQGVVVHHNNFWNNDRDASILPANDMWDAGYPAGGNYWGHPGPVDNCGGPAQNQCTGGDGISDVPQSLGDGGMDRYPLMQPNVDRENPTVVIESPDSGAVLTTPTVDLHGTASDDGPRGVMRVEVRADGNGWTTATGTLSWNATVVLLPGWNTLDARSWDYAATTSTPASRAVFYNSAPPVASFRTSSSVGITGQAMQFDSSASSDPDEQSVTLSVRWDWEGDGTWDTSWSSTKTASHAYPTAGTYHPKLEIRDFGGLVSSTTKEIAVVAALAIAPVASINSGAAPLDVTFDAGISGGLAPYGIRWDFGDGTSASDSSVHHRFSSPGSYSVSLSVADDLGQTATRSIEIRVATATGISFLGGVAPVLGLVAVLAIATATGILLSRRRHRMKPPRSIGPPENP